ncbi:peptide deformylase [Ekhidna sp. To15]|uniref:peptide deformylase n=1 Tax=Ekhidna sp. To15 TaxID=3395267 RepID=UPI003F51EFC6
MIFPIVLYGDPVLKKKASEVAENDESVKEFVENMYETMYAAQGVGLAAPQVGESLRVFVVDTMPMEEDEENGLKQAFINPIMIEEIGEEWAFEEGCLSIPGVRADVNRKPQIKIEYFDENWELHEATFDGMKARVIQHEYDHIEGKLFTDYLTPFKKRLIKGKLANISKGKTDAEYRVKVPR